MLIAILSKHANLKLNDKDIYVNVIGGMHLKEPASDLAVCMSILRALKEDGGLKIDSLACFGEIGLGGEIRQVPFLEKRIREIRRMKIKKMFIPV